YNTSEALHLSEQEKQILLTLFEQIRREYNTTIDGFTQDLMVATIELLLNYCNRFYNRQFITRTNQSKDIIIEFEKLLLDHFRLKSPEENRIPTVKSCANLLNLSPNYLSDLLKKETGKTAQEYIHLHLLERSKTQLLSSNQSIKEIAYSLGFEYPQSFSKLFKKKTGFSPSEFRTTTN
ncbi:MAG: helix-turn-helix transcriptional regulator, partial [Tunicatimonas sp.]|uniref:helix-turn-helix domain-containing protein n=1 Tax=Tunicatimonas sp. TaxID=1940096 RepID=UPI003C7447B7